MRTSPRCAVHLLVLALSLLTLTTGCDSSQGGGTTAGAGKDGAIPKALPSDDELRERLDSMIALTKARHLNPKVNNAWQIVHGVLAFGPELQITVDDKLASAVDYLLGGGALTGWNMVADEYGVEAIVEPGTKTGQGHEDQWLGYLSQCGIRPDAPLIVRGESRKVADLVTHAQRDVYQGMEATWTVMAFSTYLPLDAAWKAKDGSEWTIERLLAMEAAHDTSEGACGGTHRLYGMSTALNRYLEGKGKLEKGWKAADERIQDAIKKAQEFQSADGSFSTNFFQRAGTSHEVGVMLHATGHTLEFLTLAVTDKQLKEPWMVRAVVYLCNVLERTKKRDLECGALYHAAHGLALYRMRRFGDPSADKSNASSTTGAPRSESTANDAASDDSAPPPEPDESTGTSPETDAPPDAAPGDAR